MMKMIILLCFIISYSLNLSAQNFLDEELQIKWCSKYRDSAYRSDIIKNYCVNSNTTVTIIKDEKKIKCYEYCDEVGLFINDKRQGIWNVYEKNTHNLVAQWFYVNDEVVMALHYYKSMLISLIKYKTVHEKYDEYDYGYGSIKIIEIISYNKKGKIKKHSKLQSDGSFKLIK